MNTMNTNLMLIGNEETKILQNRGGFWTRSVPGEQIKLEVKEIRFISLINHNKGLKYHWSLQAWLYCSYFPKMHFFSVFEKIFV